MASSENVSFLKEIFDSQTEQEYISYILSRLNSHIICVNDWRSKLDRVRERLYKLTNFLNFTRTALGNVVADPYLPRSRTNVGDAPTVLEVLKNNIRV